jgi:hypothetical protein
MTPPTNEFSFVENVNVIFEPRLGKGDGEEIKEILKDYGEDSIHVGVLLQ